MDYTRRLLTAIGIAMVVILVISFTGNDYIEIEFEPEIYMEEDTVVMEGETNFEDGTLLDYRVDNYETVGPEEGTRLTGEIEVDDGEFYGEIDTAGEFAPGDIISARLRFSPSWQPEELQIEYGTGGDNLTGEAVENGRINIHRIFD